jgi:hypothetical protein
MYQKESEAGVNINLLKIANKVSSWSITRYGYFVNSTVDPLELTKAFAEELSRLPSDCLNFIENAKNKWIDEGHKRPPQMADFLTMLREFRNVHLNNVPRLARSSESNNISYQWDNTPDFKGRIEILKTVRSVHTSPATKWYMREWMRENDFTETRITAALGKPF